MAGQDFTNLLADLVRITAQNNPRPNFSQNYGLSKAILSAVPLQNPYQSGVVKQEDPRGPSFINKVLDIMSRPMYAAENFIKGNVDRAKANMATGASPLETIKDSVLQLANPAYTDERISDIWQGLSGKEKTTGRDLIQDIAPDNNLPGLAKTAIGFGLDVGLDPTTYAGFGLIPKIGKAAKVSTEALSAVEEGTGRAAQDISTEISRRAARTANEQVTIPTNAPLPSEPSRIFQAGPGSNLAEELSIPQTSRTPIAQLTEGPSTITNPTPALNEPLEALKDALNSSSTGRAESRNLRDLIPENADPLTIVKALNQRIGSAKSPIVKNLLRKQVEKLQAGVKPADLLSEVRVNPAEFPVASINPRWRKEAVDAAARFLLTNRMKNINHVGQSNLYNRIISRTRGVRKAQRPFVQLQMLRIAEDYILESGKHLTDAEGISVRLSDVANMAGGPKALTTKLVDDFRAARPSQQVEDLKAYTTPQVASNIIHPVVETGAKIADATKNLPPSQTVMIGGKLSNELAKIAESAGASSREAGTAKQFINDLFNPDRDKLYSAIQQEARALVRQSSSGIIEPAVLQKISKETYDVLGVNPKVLGRLPQQDKVVEGVMTKFATWWGAKDLRPFAREYIDTARNVAAAFAETMTPLVRHTTPTQRLQAWRVAQDKISPASVAEKDLSDQFKYMIERLMGTHGIKENAEAVVLRSGTLMQELNDELPKSLKFIDKKDIDEFGRKYDYTNGNWMHSWKEWDTSEPAESIYQLTRALQLVTRKNAMWDDAAIRWGLPQKGAEFQHQAIGIDRLSGTYFPKQIADQLTNLKKQLDRDIFKTPHKAIGLFDKVQRMWKTGVTIYSPSHHIRNLNGDVYLAMLDGVVSPRPYLVSTKILHAFSTRYEDMESVFKIMDPQLRDAALKAHPGNIVVTTRRGDKLTAEQVYQAAESQGLFIRAMHVEDIVGDNAPAFGTFGAKFKPFGGKVYGAATRVSELRDHWVRLAHFIDVLQKSNSPLRVAVEQAGRRVKKFHPDGMDLTGFEQNVLRRVIPFYSWLRKATPLVIEGAVMRPHITLMFPKAMANLQLATGIESEGPGNPFPLDQMFPNWIKEKGIGPTLMPGSPIGRHANWRGEAPGYTIVNPTQPFIDQLSMFGQPRQSIISNLTPAARIPIELLTGQTSLGIPLENVQGGTPGYLAQQIPAVGIGARVSGLTRPNEPYDPEQLINWLLTGGLVTGTGPYKAQAQVEIRDYLNKIAQQNRGNYR